MPEARQFTSDNGTTHLVARLERSDESEPYEVYSRCGHVEERDHVPPREEYDEARVCQNCA